MTTLEGPSGPLVFQALPSDGAFRLTGRRAALDGHARMGVARLKGARGEMIRALKVEARGCLRFRYSPGSLLRELEVAGGTLREVIFVPRDLTGAAFQWSLEGASAPHVLAVGWRPGEGLTVEAGPGGDGLVATLVEPGDERKVFLVSPDSSDWRLDGSGDDLRLAIDLEPGSHARLAVVEADAPPDPGLFDRLRGWERARAGQEAWAREECLGADVSGTGLDRAMAWAGARLETAALASSVSDAVWLGLAGLVTGRSELARRILEMVEAPAQSASGAPALLREQAVLWAGLPGPAPEGDEAPGIPVAGEGLHPVLRDPGMAARAAPVALARAVLALVSGTLGARPDAPVGRLTLSPALPPSWSEFQVENLPVADARVSLGYQREGTRHTFTLRQSRGRVPLNLVFRPLVSETDLAAVRLDGEPAELERVRSRGRVGSPIQLPLDREREVVLEGKS